jgi:hypothetical protein
VLHPLPVKTQRFQGLSSGTTDSMQHGCNTEFGFCSRERMRGSVATGLDFSVRSAADNCRRAARGHCAVYTASCAAAIFVEMIVFISFRLQKHVRSARKTRRQRRWQCVCSERAAMFVRGAMIYRAKLILAGSDIL